MSRNQEATLVKCPTGISGFDQMSDGGLPKGRTTLVAGYAGTGKSIFAVEFLARGVTQFNETGILLSFEESAEELTQNIASLGFDLNHLQEENKIKIVSIHLDPSQTVQSGEFTLDGIFVRLESAIDAIGASRVVLDGAETLFASISDPRLLRGEFQRLLNWLKSKNVTSLVTAEQGSGTLTRYGLEEYIADCVISLDNRVVDQIATRRMRIVKYRGSQHAGDECPFIVGETGFSVMPISSAGLDYPVSNEKVSSGVPSLDEMLGGGIYRGSSLLVTGTAGTGKTSIGAKIIESACIRGEKVLYVALEESPQQIERNMKSIGIDLGPWKQSGALHFHALRPTAVGIETHLATVSCLIDRLAPDFVVIDPITALNNSAAEHTVKQLLIRSVDLFKQKGITSIFTALTIGDEPEASTSIGISSLMDVWILLRNLEQCGERNRGIYICKARGISHSNQIREFVLSATGMQLKEVVLDADGNIYTGAARDSFVRQLDAQREQYENDVSRRKQTLEAHRLQLEAKIAELRAEYQEELRNFDAEVGDAAAREKALANARNFVKSQRINF
jgi:circadian clock protein KaiC